MALNASRIRVGRVVHNTFLQHVQPLSLDAGPRLMVVRPRDAIYRDQLHIAQ